MTVTSDSDSTETQDYRIDVTRPADTTLASLEFTPPIRRPGDRYLTGETLEPAFDPDTRNYEAIVTAAHDGGDGYGRFATSPTAEEDDITWDRGPAGSSPRAKSGYRAEHHHRHREGRHIDRQLHHQGDEDRLARRAAEPQSHRAKGRQRGDPVVVGPVGRRRRRSSTITRSRDTTSSTSSTRKTRPTLSSPMDPPEPGGQRRRRPVAQGHRRHLYNGRTYYFRVRAPTKTARATGPTMASATPAGPPLGPRGTSRFAVGNARVELTWGVPDRSRIRTTTVDSPSPREPHQQLRVLAKWEAGGASPTVTSPPRLYTVTGLNNGTTYHFQVRAKNRAGNGLRRQTRSAQYPDRVMPGAPTGLTAQAGDEEVTLSWRAPANNGGEPITRYEYKQEATSGGTETAPGPPPAARGRQ